MQNSHSIESINSVQEVYSVFFVKKKNCRLNMDWVTIICMLFFPFFNNCRNRITPGNLLPHCVNIVDIGQKNTLIIGVLTLRRQMEGYCILEKVRGEGWRFLGLQNRVHFILGLASENGSFLKHQCNLSALRLSA